MEKLAQDFINLVSDILKLNLVCANLQISSPFHTAVFNNQEISLKLLLEEWLAEEIKSLTTPMNPQSTQNVPEQKRRKKHQPERKDFPDESSKEKEKDPFSLYLRDMASFPKANKEEGIILGKLAHEKNAEARDKLITGNLRLVFYLAKKYIGKGVEFSELVAEGNIGLILAADRYNPEKGAAFSTYATWWIRQAIERMLLKRSLIHFPINQIMEMNKIFYFSASFLQENGREPGPEEISSGINLSAESIRELSRLSSMRTCCSLDAMEDEETLSWEETIGNEEGMIAEDDRHGAKFSLSPEDKLLAKEEMIDYLNLVVKIDKLLPSHKRKRAIFYARLGIGDFNTQTLEAVGQKFHLTRERIRQIIKDCYKFLDGVISPKEMEALMDKIHSSVGRCPLPEEINQ